MVNAWRNVSPRRPLPELRHALWDADLQSSLCAEGNSYVRFPVRCYADRMHRKQLVSRLSDLVDDAQTWVYVLFSFYGIALVTMLPLNHPFFSFWLAVVIIVYGHELPQTTCKQGSYNAKSDRLFPWVCFSQWSLSGTNDGPRSLLATLETIFVGHQTYDIFITRLGKKILLDEIVLYVMKTYLLRWDAVNYEWILVLWQFVALLLYRH